MLEILLGFIVILIGLVVLTSIFLLHKTAPTQSTPKRTKVTVNPKKVNLPKRASSVSSRLQKEFLLLVHGDRETAERLISNLRLKYPQKQETWYWEKAIFDLKRDRHY